MKRQKEVAKEPQTRNLSERFVFDACALIAYFNDETGANKIELLVERAKAGEVQAACMSINVYEVYYDAVRRNNQQKAEELLSDIYALPITIVELIDRTIMVQAGYFKAKYKMSVADSFALALAKKLGAKIVTTDHHEFDPIEENGEMDFFWLR